MWDFGEVNNTKAQVGDELFFQYAYNQLNTEV